MSTNYLTIKGDTYRKIAEFIGIDSDHVAEAAHILYLFNHSKLGEISIDTELPAGFNIDAPGSSTLSDGFTVSFAALFDPHINELRQTTEGITAVKDSQITLTDAAETGYVSQSLVSDLLNTDVVALDSTIASAQENLVNALPDTVTNALETTGNVTQNIVDTIYTATGNDSTQNTDVEKTARAKKVLLGISAGILAFKIFS